MRLLNDIVAVQRRQANTTIELVNHKETIGEVMGVGPGRWFKRNGKDCFHPTTVKEGDYVMFSPRSGQDHEVDGEEMTFIHEADILCILDPNQVQLTENALGESGREVVGEFNFGV